MSENFFETLLAVCPFVILSDSEEFDIIEILRRSAPQNDTAWTFYECIKIDYDQVVPNKRQKQDQGDVNLVSS